ncbi:hypothetical protein M5689_011802 [Euphorbia peplus]|nr:hypothetical protein M5689_011802 [Euphorbia peplus]
MYAEIQPMANAFYPVLRNFIKQQLVPPMYIFEESRTYLVSHAIFIGIVSCVGMFGQQEEISDAKNALAWWCKVGLAFALLFVILKLLLPIRNKWMKASVHLVLNWSMLIIVNVVRYILVVNAPTMMVPWFLYSMTWLLLLFSGCTGIIPLLDLILDKVAGDVGQI